MEIVKTLLGEKNKILCVIGASLLFASICASLIGNNVESVVEEYKNYRKYGGDVILYDYSDVRTINYIVHDQNFVSVNNDPQLIIPGVNRYVEVIDIFFEMPITQDIPIEIFWGVEGESFVADRIRTTVVRKGQKEIRILLQEKITDLRLDVGTSENVTFELSSIAINQGIPKTLLDVLIWCIKENTRKEIWFDRFQIILLVCVFALIHFVVDVKKMYHMLFDKRWFVAGVILLFMVMNKYHGDSITCFDNYVQPGIGSEYIYPIIGEGRPIRSDEWLVGTPINLSTQYLKNPYGQYNNLIRATDTVNSNALTIISILNPVSLVQILIRVIFGYNYAYSYGWYINIFLAFLFQLELFLIISSRKKLLSVCGTCMVILSSNYLWWAFPSIILYSSVALVCAYYFFRSKTKIKRLLYAYGTTLGTASFVLILYPAWEVPMSFYALAVFTWIIHVCWGDIRKMFRADWIIFCIALLLCVVLVASSMISSRDYIEAISSTVYPGARVEYGGFSITKLFNYISAVMFPYKDCGNPSECGMYITLFPFSFIMALYVWFKVDKKNWLLNGLIIVSIFLGIYTTVGLPPAVAKITLMTNSVAGRCVDILGYIQVVLFVVILSNLNVEDKLSIKHAVILSTIMSSVAMICANRSMPDYMSGEFKILFFELLLLVFFSCITKTNKRIYSIGLILIILIAVATGIYVRPICQGTDAIYSKPVAKQIQRIVAEDREAKWIASDTHVTPQFALACGAPVINSVNKYPNMNLWDKLDPMKVNDFFYNRYAHIIVTFTSDETNIELIQDDLIRLNLGFSDLEKTEAKYIFSLQPLEVNNEYVEFDEIYYEYGAYIYEVLYH